MVPLLVSVIYWFQLRGVNPMAQAQIVYHKRTNGYSFRNPETQRFYPFDICGYWVGQYDVWHRVEGLPGVGYSRKVKAGTFETLADATAWIMQAIDHL